MVQHTTPVDVTGTLCHRAGVLAELVDSPCEKRTLVEEFDMSRSTLDRAIRELESLDLVTYEDGKYGVTSIGEWIVRPYFEFISHVDLALKLEPFLQWIPFDEFDLPLVHLDDAEIYTAEPGNPYAMVDKHVRTLAEVDDLRAVLPIVGLNALRTVHEQVLENGADFDIVVSPEARDTLRSQPAYAPLFEELITTDHVTVQVYDGRIPYYVGVFDDERVQIGVHDAEEPRALLECDRQEVCAWAHATIESYKRQATVIEGDANVAQSQVEHPSFEA